MTLSRKFWVVGVVLSCLLLLKYEIGSSNIGFPAPGNSGDPTSIPTPGLTCGQCHAGGIHPVAGNAEIWINDTVSVDSLKYMPGQTYKVTFKSLVSAARYGFQLSALTPANENAGAFTRTDLNKTELLPGAPPKSIKYISHQNADTTKVWSFDWTAPASGTGNVTFYYAFIASNASETNDGDTVYAGSTVIKADTTFNSITGSNTLTGLSVYPNPAKGAIYIQSTTFAGQPAYVALYSLAGTLVWHKTTAATSTIAINTTGLPTGIYLMHIMAGDKHSMVKVVVE